MDTVTDQNTVAEIKAYLDAHNIAYSSSATKADLLALVTEQQGTMTAATEEESADGTGESEEPTDTGTGDESTEPEQPAEPIKVSSFDLDKTDVAVDSGKEAKVNVTNILPEDAADKTIVVTSNDETIATVMVHTDGSIGVQGVKEGSTTAEVKSNDGGVTKELTITVKDPVISVTGISMTEDNPTTGLVGEDIVLGAIIAPENATNQNMDWVSSDESLAAFTKTGAPAGHKILSLLKAGQVTVTATTEDGSKSISQTIDITEPVVIMTGFDLDKTSLSGETGGNEVVTLSNIQPTNATDKAVEVVLDDGSIVSVQDNGDSTYTVSFLAAGSTTIHWNSRDDGTTLAVPVTVTEPVPTAPELQPWEIMLINHESAPYPVPPTDTYTVQAGETLADIATAHMMSLARLKKLNGLTVNVLPAGRVIRLS